MKINRISAAFLALVLLLTATSCKNETQEETTAQSNNSNETVFYEETFPAIEETFPLQETTEAYITEASTAENTTAQALTEAATEEETASAAADVSLWGADKIVPYYQLCAAKTGSGLSSEQRVELMDISVNNGALSGMFSFVTPILSGFLSENVTVTEGITGEYSLLGTGDIASAKAYTVSKGTAVEMTLNPQTSKASDDTSSGSVAHGISVVADFGGIMEQLKDAGLPIDISADKAVMKYTDPVIKVFIDDSGKIVNGTWSCTVEISLSDYKFAGAKVDSTVVILKNTITAGGGFSA